MKTLSLCLLLLLGLYAHAANLDPAKRTTVIVGGNDPTKLPLAGGTLTGPTTFQAFVSFSSTTASGDSNSVSFGGEVFFSSNTTLLGPTTFNNLVYFSSPTYFNAQVTISSGIAILTR